MKFEPLLIEGAYLCNTNLYEDSRGFFYESWNENFFSDTRIHFKPQRQAFGFNPKLHTLRGLHMQSAPHADAKVITVIQGKLLDVLLDLRPSSKTFKKWVSVELSAKNKKTLFIPEGVAHGYLTLEENTMLSYSISEYFFKENSVVVRYNDPSFQISWPYEPAEISDQDRNAKDWN